jgi:hypothetical protein
MTLHGLFYLISLVPVVCYAYGFLEKPIRLSARNELCVAGAYSRWLLSGFVCQCAHYVIICC